MSTISYAQMAAQAAGSQPPQPSAPQSVSSQTASTTSSQSRDATAANTTSAPSVAASTTSNDVDATENIRKYSVQTEAVTKGDTVTLMQSNKEEVSVHKATSTEDAEPYAPEVKRAGADAWSQSSERRGKGPNSSSARTSDVSERKSKKSKKVRGDKDSEQDQSNEKEENDVPKVPLSEAPIPTVNIWQQRAQLAQAAKAPARPASNPIAPSSGATTSSGVVDTKPRPTGSNENEIGTSQSRPVSNGVKSQRRVNESARDSNEQGARRNIPRGRVSDKIEKGPAESLPSVTDASSWPTPETAVTELKAQDKIEKPQEKEEVKDESGPKSRQKWTKVPHVPTPVFSTPMPPRGGSRGGRLVGSRGGRENSTRGNHAGASASSDRVQSGTKSLGAPQDRTQDNGARGRAASTASHIAKQASVDHFVSRDVRNEFGGASTEAAKPSAGPSALINGKEESVKYSQEDASSIGSDQQQVPATTNGTVSAAGASLPKDNGHQNAKDFGHAASSRSEGGRDRPRGNHRGRGAHTGSSGQSHHGPFSTNGQQFGMPSMSARQSQYVNFQPQYNGNVYGGANPGHGSRMSGRHNSTPSASYYPRSQANGPSSRIPPIQTSNPQWDPSMHPLSAFPGHHLPPFFPAGDSHLLQMVSTQIEYYFSTDNLCKDMFLRSHMDTQGFVFVDLIASFSRMRQLTTDYSLIRVACEESQLIDFVMGDDGRERLRVRANPDSWVLPKESRHEAVKNDGPASWYIIDRSLATHGYPPHMLPPHGVQSPAVFSPGSIDPQYTSYMNGGSYGQAMSNGTNDVNGHVAAGESQLSAAVPEFSPSGLGSFDLSNVATKSGKDKGAENGTPFNSEIGLTNGSSEETMPAPAQLDEPYTNGVNGGHEAASS